MPPVEIELEIPYNIQIAALLSLGLVYVKSANKHLSYVLLKEIGRLPGNEVDKDLHSLDREAYSLTAGLALGLILLEKGKKSLTIMDSTFTDVLYHYMVGGHKEKYSEGGALASGAGAVGSQSASVSAANENNMSGTNNFSSNFRTNNNSYIREGESINTNVTCPGATLALGLIYFNSCDKLIAEWFAPPDSAFLLDSIRPDFLLLRTVARNLIMWKYMLPTQTWLIGQLSSLLKTTIRNDKVLNEKFSSLLAAESKQQTLKTAPTAKVANNKIEKMPRVISKDVNSKANVKKPTSSGGISSEEFYLLQSQFKKSVDSTDDSDDDNEVSSQPSEELKYDTDEDNIIVIQKQIKSKQFVTKRNKGKSSKEGAVRKHLLSDLISFDDVEDDSNFEELSKKPRPSNLRKVESGGGGQNDEDDFEYLSNNFDSNSNSSESQTNLIDDETKVEAFRHIIAGACMSIGLKFAGTFNNEAYQTLVSSTGIIPAT
jgi:hypothetical protein